MRTKKILLSLLLSSLCLTVTQAQEFWFPNTPKDPNTTILRPGRTGIGIPTTSFNAFNTSTGRYTVANRVGLLVQGSNFTDVFNMGHLLTGDYGEEKVGDVWTAIGGPGNPNIAGLPLYGTRHQFDRYSVNMALTDRNIITGASGTSGIRDAIMFWDASPANDSRMYIGKTLGQGRISPDIVINPNGNVGIGTANPKTKLDVRGAIDIGAGLSPNPPLRLSFNIDRIPFIIGNNGLRLFITKPTSALGREIAISISDFNPTGLAPISISGDRIAFGLGIGSSLIPSPSAFPRGDLDLGSSLASWDNIFADNFINTSDRRAKEKIEPISYGLAHIKKLNPVTYQWRNQPDKSSHTGLIAQEVLEVIPDVVYDPTKDIQYDSAGRALPVDPNARYGIRYNELIPVMIKAMQEMSQKMEEQDTKIEEQQKIIAELTGGNTREIEEGLGIDNNGSQGASVIELFQNTPNPFDQSTTIRYYLPEGTEKAQLFIYNIDGQQVRSMELTETGEGAMTITAGELGAGIYFYTLYADGEVSQTRKMILTE